MKAYWIQSSALVLALAYLLAACGTGATISAPPTPVASAPTAAPTQPAQATAAPAPTAAPPTAPPTDTTQAGAADLLITYHKSGGFAGVNETLTVYADGTTELQTKADTVTAQADPSAIADLQKLLASPEFAALQVPAQPPAADQFVYELTLPGRAKPIVATDGAENPPVLRELIGALEQLKGQVK